MNYGEDYYTSCSDEVYAKISNDMRVRAYDYKLSVGDMTHLMAEEFASPMHVGSSKSAVEFALKTKAKAYLTAKADQRFKNRFMRVQLVYSCIWVMLAMAIFSEIIKIIMEKWWDRD